MKTTSKLLFIGAAVSLMLVACKKTDVDNKELANTVFKLTGNDTLLYGTWKLDLYTMGNDTLIWFYLNGDTAQYYEEFAKDDKYKVHDSILSMDAVSPTGTFSLGKEDRKLKSSTNPVYIDATERTILHLDGTSLEISYYKTTGSEVICRYKKQ